jgi:hypothetical protein
VDARRLTSSRRAKGCHIQICKYILPECIYLVLVNGFSDCHISLVVSDCRVRSQTQTRRSATPKPDAELEKRSRVLILVSAKDDETVLQPDKSTLA